MLKPLYIFQSGTLRRRQNTLVYEMGTQRVSFPVESIKEVHLFGETTLNTRVMNFLAVRGIPVHCYNYYGHYTGSLYPREQNISGLVVIRQSEHYLDPERRLWLAQRMVEGSIFNMVYVLRYYHRRGRSFQSEIDSMEGLLEQISTLQTIDQVRGSEGKARDLYFAAWDGIISQEPFRLQKRERRPPSNPVNALISFGNGLLYATVVSELFHVHLHGGISFVHEPGSYRFSLALDIADIFKPVIVDRLIFSLVNRRQIQLRHFEVQSHYAYLKENGRKLFVERWQKQMETTVKHPQLRRNVSYRHLIRLECYKLIKHFLGEKPYKPFKIWW